MTRRSHKTLKDGTLMTWPECQYHQRRWLAVMPWREIEPDATDDEIDRVLDAYDPESSSGYVAYTDLRSSRLPYPRIFAAVRTLHHRDPYSVRATVNRMNENTYISLAGAAAARAKERGAR